MKIDVYTKIVLTVIAVCLVAITLRSTFITDVEANPGVVDVCIRRISPLITSSLPVEIAEISPLVTSALPVRPE